MYDPQQSVDAIFNKIKLFQDICLLTEDGKPNKKIFPLGYVIFNCTQAYTDSLKTWSAKTRATKNYANFQTYMHSEFHTLRQAGSLAIEDSSINMLQELTAHQKNLRLN